MAPSNRRYESFAARVTPAVLTLLITFITAIPAHIFDSGIVPGFTLICIFYWGVYSPGALSYLFIFFLGVLQDGLSGTPLGISSFLYLGLSYLLHSQRKLMGRAQFGTVWLSCMLLSALATMAEWSIICLYSGKAYDLTVPGMCWVATCIAYPPMHLLLTQVYKRIRQ